MTPPDHLGDDGTPHAGDGVPAQNLTRLRGVLDGTYAPIDSGKQVPVRRVRRALRGVPVADIGAVGSATSNNTSATGLTFRRTYQLAVGVTEIRLVFPFGFYVQASTGETLMAASIPVKASIEAAGGIRRVTFGGLQQGTADPGGILVSDPLSVDLAAGAQVAVRTWLNIGNGVAYPRLIGGGGPAITQTGDGFDTTDTTGVATAVGSANTNYFANPILVGEPTSTTTPIVGALGDSIVLGIGETSSPQPNYSWVTRGMAAQAPLLVLATQGNRASYVASNPGSHYSLSLIDGCTHAIVMLGTNDFANGGASWATLQANLTTIYTNLRNRGLRVYGATMLPRTTSTDSWATTANQTVVSGFEAGGASKRGLHNAWVRSLAGGLLDGYIETADQVETARDSGLWKVNGTANYGTTDGIHPTTVLHTAMASAFSAATFTVTP